MKLHILTYILLNTLLSFVFCNSTISVEHEEFHPIHPRESSLIVNGQNLQQDIVVQILISFFLVIAYTDFIFQTILFLYVFFGLVSAFKKCSEYLYATFGLLIYFLLRLTFVPFLIAPIPWGWAPTLPDLFVEIPLYINMAMFVFFYSLAAIACLYYMFFIGVTGKKLPGNIIDPITGLEPMVVVLMPIYNEEPDALFRAVESAIRCNYRPDRLHIFLAFDEASETPLYFALLKKLKVLSKEVSEEIKSKFEQFDNDNNSFAGDQKPIEIFPPRLEWFIEGVRLTICRFPHEGKSPTQGKAFKVINDNYGLSDEATSANTLILFIDSDIILHENAIHNFVQPAVTNPKIKGMTGLVTCRTSRSFNFYQYLQDAEYIDGQMFNRTAEALLGAVTCLPGALTLIRLNALQKVAPKYFIEIDKRRTVDFHRFHLGEDRYMTYLLTEEADGPYQVKFVSSATCKTDAPDSLGKLIKQRRRWFLGGFVNDVSTLISPVMWNKVPLVVLMKSHFYSSKGVDWIFPILIISIATNQNPGVALYLLVGVFCLRYLLLCLNALVMTRTKVCASYVFLFFLSPFFNWIVTVYAVWTWGVRSWGGPRTDDDDGGRVKSPINLLDEAMAQKEEGVGQTRRSLAQIQTISKVLHDNLKAGSIQGSIRSVGSSKSNLPPLKKYVPFPYQAEFLGGGGFEDNIEVTLRPPSPTMSLRSLQIPSQSLSSPKNQLSIQMYQHHSSMPDIHKLSKSASSNNINDDLPYLFAKLDPATQRRASSFRLDREYLAKFGDLVPQDSEQKDSSFNMRLSGRMSPTGTGSLYGGGGGSREPSLYSFNIDSESKASSLSFDVVDEESNGDKDNNNDYSDNSHSVNDNDNFNSYNYYSNNSNSINRNIPQINIVIDSIDD